ncbi:DUF1351 domain-containing protein [Roseburia inulinivorans]|jgi:hypothetical protein|uniref:DUF1351 domain-containing protein n=1 Tax=Roseburia inulinivorans TaxID=360807 RepID=UPI0032BF3176
MEEIRVNVEQKNGVIGFNFEEIKEKLNSELEIYKNMIFTEESKTEAKKTIASLRKLKKSVNDKKLEVKKSFMIPYTNFEAQVKELDNLIDEPINFINNQVEEFERKRVEEKKALISEIYTEIMAEHVEASGYLPLQRIYDSKWENATTTKKAITETITERVDHVEKDLGIIRSMESEFEDKGIEKYKATLELSDAIEVMNQYQKQKEEILRRQEEEAKRKAEEEARNESEKNSEPDIAVNETPITDNVPEEKFVEPKPANNVVTYEVVADPFQIVQLEAQMRSLEIKYRRLR